MKKTSQMLGEKASKLKRTNAQLETTLQFLYNEDTKSYSWAKVASNGTVTQRLGMAYIIEGEGENTKFQYKMYKDGEIPENAVRLNENMAIHLSDIEKIAQEEVTPNEYFVYLDCLIDKNTPDVTIPQIQDDGNVEYTKVPFLKTYTNGEGKFYSMKSHTIRKGEFKNGVLKSGVIKKPFNVICNINGKDVTINEIEGDFGNENYNPVMLKGQVYKIHLADGKSVIEVEPTQDVTAFDQSMPAFLGPVRTNWFSRKINSFCKAASSCWDSILGKKNKVIPLNEEESEGYNKKTKFDERIEDEIQANQINSNAGLTIEYAQQNKSANMTEPKKQLVETKVLNVPGHYDKMKQFAQQLQSEQANKQEQAESNSIYASNQYKYNNEEASQLFIGKTQMVDLDYLGDDLKKIAKENGYEYDKVNKAIEKYITTKQEEYDKDPNKPHDSEKHVHYYPIYTEEELRNKLTELQEPANPLMKSLEQLTASRSKQRQEQNTQKQ